MNLIEEERRKSELNQKRMLRDFLEMQVHEKKARETIEQLQKTKDLDVSAPDCSRLDI